MTVCSTHQGTSDEANGQSLLRMIRLCILIVGIILTASHFEALACEAPSSDISFQNLDKDKIYRDEFEKKHTTEIYPFAEWHPPLWALNSRTDIVCVTLVHVPRNTGF